MNRHQNAKILILLATHGIWGFLIALWNDFLAILPIYFYLGGIFVILPAIRLDFARGFICTVLSGCFLDATLPIPFGFHACFLAIAYVALRTTDEKVLFSRRRIPVITALIINLALFLSLHIWFTIQLPEGGEILHARAFIDLICSELLLFAVFPWLMDLHLAFLTMIGIEKTEIQKTA